MTGSELYGSLRPIGGVLRSALATKDKTPWNVVAAMHEQLTEERDTVLKTGAEALYRQSVLIGKLTESRAIAHELYTILASEWEEDDCQCDNCKSARLVLSKCEGVIS